MEPFRSSIHRAARAAAIVIACAAGSVTPAAQRAARVEDATRTMGPFTLRPGSTSPSTAPPATFTVVLHEKHITGAGNTDPDSQTTLAEIEIRDAAGTPQFRQTFPVSVADGQFAESLIASAEIVKGRTGTSLLVTYSTLPSTPLGGNSWAFFGVFDGKLVAMARPIAAEGGLVEEGAGGAIDAAAGADAYGGLLHVRVWTGNFFVVYPLRLDMLAAKAMPAIRCVTPASGRASGRCRYPVEANRIAPEGDQTFVRLFVEPDEHGATPRHVIVTKGSRLEILEADGEVRWNEQQDIVGLDPGDDFWLHVRIDGRDGWIHTQEDFDAIGLPQAG